MKLTKELIYYIESETKRRTEKIFDKVKKDFSKKYNEISKGCEEKIFRFVDEAKLEKEKLASLYGAKQKIFAKASCGKCGREGKKGSFCHSCGEYLK